MNPLVGLLPTPFDTIVWNFVMGGIVALVYIFTVIGLMDKAVEKGFPADLSRKIIHIAAGSWIWIWPLMDPSNWSYIFNIAVALLWTMLFVKLGTKGSPDDTAVKTMTRTGNPKELLKGPLYFTLAMEFVGIFYFMNFIGVIAMAMLGWGDGLAPYIGKKYGAHKYKLLGREKTIEGSLTVFFVSVFAAFLFVTWMFGIPTTNMILWIILLALIGTIVEAVSPADIDNILIPLVIIIVCILFAPLLPAGVNPYPSVIL